MYIRPEGMVGFFRETHKDFTCRRGREILTNTRDIMETKWKFNVDRMEITYTSSPELRALLAEQKGMYVCGADDDVVLKRENNLTYNHTFSVFCKDLPVGELYFDSPNPNRPYIYISVNNEILYECLAGISYIEQALGLTYYRISKLDVCLDTNRNIINRFYQLLRDESQTLIINNKAIKDRKATVKSLLHVSIGSLDSIHRFKSFYVKGNGIELKAYDKREEIEESGKEYIKENLDLGKRIYRMEVRLPNHKQVKTALEMCGVDKDELYYHPFSDNIEVIFVRNLNRIIHLKGRYCLLDYLLQK